MTASHVPSEVAGDQRPTAYGLIGRGTLTFGVPDYGPPPPNMPIPNRLNLCLVALVFCGGVALLWLGSQVTVWYAVMLIGMAFSYLMLTNYALLHEASHGNLHSMCPCQLPAGSHDRASVSDPISSHADDAPEPSPP